MHRCDRHRQIDGVGGAGGGGGGSHETTYCEIGRKEMFYLTTHSTHFIYGYMALDIL